LWFYNFDLLIFRLHALCVSLLPYEINPSEILIEIVNLGYDTDTVAAIAGTILGARFGYSWIPVQRFMDFNRLSEYSNALLERGNSNIESIYNFMEVETKWTKFEDEFQSLIVKKYSLNTPSSRNRTQKTEKRKIKNFQRPNKSSSTYNESQNEENKEFSSLQIEDRIE